MKFAQILRVALDSRSLPVRGAWVEMSGSSIARVSLKCRSPCGERGLKLLAAGGSGWPLGRSPCGERGLKYRANAILGKYSASLPVRGAWIEINCQHY